MLLGTVMGGAEDGAGHTVMGGAEDGAGHTVSTWKIISFWENLFPMTLALGHLSRLELSLH